MGLLDNLVMKIAGKDPQNKVKGVAVNSQGAVKTEPTGSVLALDSMGNPVELQSVKDNEGKNILQTAVANQVETLEKGYIAIDSKNQAYDMRQAFYVGAPANQEMITILDTRVVSQKAVIIDGLTIHANVSTIDKLRLYITIGNQDATTHNIQFIREGGKDGWIDFYRVKTWGHPFFEITNNDEQNNRYAFSLKPSQKIIAPAGVRIQIRRESVDAVNVGVDVLYREMERGE